MATQSSWDLNNGWDEGFKQATKPFEERNKLFQDYQKILDNAYKLDETANTQDARVDAANAVSEARQQQAEFEGDNVSARREGIEALANTPEFVDEDDGAGGTRQRRLTQWERYDLAVEQNPDITPWAREKLRLSGNQKALEELKRTSSADPVAAIQFGVDRGLLRAGYEALPANSKNASGEEQFVLKTPSGSQVTLSRSALMAQVHDMTRGSNESLRQRQRELSAEAQVRAQAQRLQAQRDAARMNMVGSIARTVITAGARGAPARAAAGAAGGGVSIDPFTGAGFAASGPATAAVAPSAAAQSPAAPAAAPAAPGAAAAQPTAAAAPAASSAPAPAAPDPVQAEIDRIDALWRSAQSDGIDDREMQAAYLNRRNQLLLQQRSAANSTFESERSRVQQAWDAREQARLAAGQREEQQRVQRREQAMRAFSGN